ncbi:MAG: DUF5011 domain-containing protein [Coriobacteriales bacterium]|nr:DUF5011 domain-containing protein [Coriobacteriales bacterium]
MDTKAPGSYHVHFSVTDADNNTAEADRIVVVNDGRYKVGKGRILSASSFVIALKDVAADDAGKLSQVRGKTSVRLTAGANESASVRAGDVLPADQTRLDTGGYTNKVAVYPITATGTDFPSTAPAITRKVSAEVVDKDVVVFVPGKELPGAAASADSYYVFGNNIVLTPLQADAIQKDADANAALLKALGAGGRKTEADGTLSNLDTIVADAGGFFERKTDEQATGSYKVVISDRDKNASATLSVTVGKGALPEIVAIPTPLVVPVRDKAGLLTPAELMVGVSAKDAEDGDITSKVIIDQNGDGKADEVKIDASVPGVTKVTYSVTDSAGNTATVARAVIIDDGSYRYNANYILRANSFIIRLSDVATKDKAAQIKERSEARAWKSDGTELAKEKINVDKDGGYQKVIGEYLVTLNLLDDPSLIRSITAKVYDDGKEGKNGDRYSILGENFVINVPDANATAAKTAEQIASELIARAGVKSYKRSGDMSFEQGSKKLVSATLQGSGESFASLAGKLKEGDKFNVTFWVDEDHSATITVVLTVTNRTAPVLYVPPVKVVAKDATFAEGAFDDKAPSYLQGVYATDSEDGALPASAIKHDSPVDSSREGAYKVTYNVTDSDHNRVERSGMVLVGDWLVAPGDKHIIAGHSPVRLKLSQVAAANADLRKSAGV